MSRESIDLNPESVETFAFERSRGGGLELRADRQAEMVVIKAESLSGSRGRSHCAVGKDGLNGRLIRPISAATEHISEPDAGEPDAGGAKTLGKGRGEIHR